MTRKVIQVHGICFLTAIMTAVTLISCMSSSVQWVTQAEENSFIELTPGDAALVRSIYCDVYLEPVDEIKWKKLLGFYRYATGNPHLKTYDIPPLEFMHFIVTNTGDDPLIIKDAFIEAGGEVIRSLSAEEIQQRFPYKRYDIFNFKNLFAMRRFTGEKEDIMSIDYPRQTLDLRFDFISPGDTVVFLRAFDWVSFSYDRYTVAIIVQSGNYARRISFKLKRVQYRKGGPDFRAPEKRSYDDIL